MIEMTNLNSSFSSQQSAKKMRASHDPSAFAKKLDDASNKANNRRQITGKMTEKPEKGEGRKVWAQERSRSDNKAENKTENEIDNKTENGIDNKTENEIDNKTENEIDNKTENEIDNKNDNETDNKTENKTDQMKEVRSDIKESNNQLDQTDQDEAMKSGHGMLMWLRDIPEEFHGVANFSMESDMAISEDSVKKLLLWMQSMTEVDKAPEELKAIVENLKALLQDQNGLVTSNLTTDQKTEIEAFLVQMHSLTESMMETYSTVITEIKSTDEEVSVLKQSNITVEVISENVPVDTGKIKETPVKQEGELTKENTIVEDPKIKIVTTNISDDQANEKWSAFQGKPDETITQEQTREAVIPFSLTQIETFLQQNTMTVALNQEQSQTQQNVMQQIVDKIQVIQGTNQSFVSLHLTPEHLGKLTIQLISDMQQGMTAKIYAETPQAKEMIETNFGQLKDALSGKGVNLTAMEVFVGQDPESSEKQREFQYQQARAQRRRGSRISKITNSDRTALVSEIPLSDNPYVINEGFDQLG